MRYTYVRELVEGEADGVVEASGSAGAIDVGARHGGAEGRRDGRLLAGESDNGERREVELADAVVVAGADVDVLAGGVDDAVDGQRKLGVRADAVARGRGAGARERLHDAGERGDADAVVRAVRDDHLARVGA